MPLTPLQARIIAGARAQIGNGYNASYCLLSYPNGDPPPGQGACTDVVVRSLRAGGYDLQPLVHEDMTRHWNQYPHRWGLPGPDPNIDHRRVPNLAVFFQRHGQTLPIAVTPKTLPTWQPGDVVTWRMPGGGDHCGIVSDRRDLAGVPAGHPQPGPRCRTGRADAVDDCRALPVSIRGTIHVVPAERLGQRSDVGEGVRHT